MVGAEANHQNGAEDEDIELLNGYKEIEEKNQLMNLSTFDNVLVVDNVPLVNTDRKQKLLDRLRAKFAQSGAPLQGNAREGEDAGYDDMEMPWDEAADSNKGFMFITYPTVEDASAALQALDQTLFGKSRLTVNRFSDIERYATMDIEEGGVPRGWQEETEPVPQEHLKSWLADLQGRDQYATYKHESVDINWIGRSGGSEPAVESQPRWGEMHVSWSPSGTYFVTLHRMGVALWSGKSFKTNPHQRFTHNGARLIDFSPCEKYLVTFSPEPIAYTPPKDENAPQNPRQFGPDDHGNKIAVWEVKTGLLLRTFPGEPPSPPVAADAPPPRKLAWPLLRWSPDDKYVARCHMNSHISVYELPGMGLLEKKSIKIDGVLDFEWCPDKELASSGKENMFAYWTPASEDGNQPARVTLMAVPSRNVLRSKNLFNVIDCQLRWQDQGTYLCVKVDRSKSKLATFSNFELFRVKEKNYPVETIEHKETCLQFAWESSGSRFAAIMCADPNPKNPTAGSIIKTNVEFYHLDPKKGDFKLLRRLDPKTSNTVLWSPKGRFIVLATVGSAIKYDIEFWDVDFTIDDSINKRDAAEPGANMQMLAAADHFGMTELAWDPSGRYLASSASSWRQSPEPGYNLWDFKGQDLLKQPTEKFKQFAWRPRPATLLGKDDQKKVRKNLRDFSRQFDEEDAAEESNVSAELTAHRKRLIDEWNAWRAKRTRELLAERKKEGLDVLPQHGEADGDLETVEEMVEDILEESEEVVVE